MILDHFIEMLSLAYAMLCEKLKGMERFQNAQILFTNWNFWSLAWGGGRNMNSRPI